MRLLFVTQVVDQHDAVLGFIHSWLGELASQYDSIEVICLYEGVHTLPANVRVHSLGKNRGKKPSFVYALRFLSLAWSLRSQYDHVLVHMNQEYLLISGWLWKLLGKRMYLWRNHYAGSWLTDVAAFFCTKVFCTSTHSYTAKYRKTVLMPVGVDTDRFQDDGSVARNPRSILFLARMSASKRPDILIEALGMLIRQGASFTASFYGSPPKADETYYENLKHQVERLGLHDRVRFYPSVANEKAPNVFQAHDIFVNCSPSGMYDKTLFEAVASGCLVLAASDDFARVSEGTAFTDAGSLADQLSYMLTASQAQQGAVRERQRTAAAANTLPLVIQALADTMRNI